MGRSWDRLLNAVLTDVLSHSHSYAFEALMINEFSGRQFDCVSFVPSGPGYTGLGAAQTVCSAVGAVAGSNTVDGETYINIAYDYYHGHKWRCAIGCLRSDKPNNMLTYDVGVSPLIGTSV